MPSVPRAPEIARPMITPLLYVWGDDELVAERLVGRFATALAGELGTPLERWDLRGDLATAATGAAQLHERLATATLFGGGTLAVVTNPGALVRRNDTRDRVIEAISMLAAGNAVAFVEAAKSGAKGPGSKRLVDAVKAAGGAVAQAMAPRPTGARCLDRDRGARSRPGAGARRGPRARRPAGQPGHRGRRRAPLPEPDRVRRARQAGAAPCHRRRPGHGRRRAGARGRGDAGLGVGPDRRGRGATRGRRARPRSIASSTSTPEPVLLAVLHRRVVELLELGDRLAAARRSRRPPGRWASPASTGQRPWPGRPGSGRPRSSFARSRASSISTRWSRARRVRRSDTAQRRLAFTMWVGDHAARNGSGERRAGPG